jgi:hypothetical protein
MQAHLYINKTLVEYELGQAVHPKVKFEQIHGHWAIRHSQIIVKLFHISQTNPAWSLIQNDFLGLGEFAQLAIPATQ